jgi:hypothetical protein
MDKTEYKISRKAETQNMKESKILLEMFLNGDFNSPTIDTEITADGFIGFSFTNTNLDKIFNTNNLDIHFSNTINYIGEAIVRDNFYSFSELLTTISTETFFQLNNKKFDSYFGFEYMRSKNKLKIYFHLSAVKKMVSYNLKYHHRTQKAK